MANGTEAKKPDLHVVESTKRPEPTIEQLLELATQELARKRNLKGDKRAVVVPSATLTIPGVMKRLTALYNYNEDWDEANAENDTRTTSKEVATELIDLVDDVLPPPPPAPPKPPSPSIEEMIRLALAKAENAPLAISAKKNLVEPRPDQRPQSAPPIDAAIIRKKLLLPEFYPGEMLSDKRWAAIALELVKKNLTDITKMLQEENLEESYEETLHSMRNYVDHHHTTIGGLTKLMKSHRGQAVGRKDYRTLKAEVLSVFMGSTKLKELIQLPKAEESHGKAEESAKDLERERQIQAIIVLMMKVDYLKDLGNDAVHRIAKRAAAWFKGTPEARLEQAAREKCGAGASADDRRLSIALATAAGLSDESIQQMFLLKAREEKKKKNKKK